MILSGKEIKYYHTIEGDYDKYSSCKYNRNTGIQPSLLYRDFLK